MQEFNWRLGQSVIRRRVWLRLLCLALASVGPTDAHHLNPENTQIAFEIKRLGLTWFSAAFGDLSGEFLLGGDGQGGDLNVTVRTASIDARSAYWNERLRSPQWLDTTKFPEMIYRSTRIELDGPAHASVRGELTLHGVTRPLTLTITDIDCDLSASARQGGCRFVGHGELRRSEFGLPHSFWTGGDTVDIVVRGR